MSLKLTRQAFRQPLNDTPAKFLLVAMSFISNTGNVWAATHTLMQMTGLTERSIRRKIKYLVDHGYLVKHDVDRFQITDRNADSLSDVLDRNADSLSNNSDSLSNPYIENGINGKGTVMNGIVSISQFLEGADMGGIPREYAKQWYERQEEQGWFWNINTGKPKPFAVKDALMIRFCLREFNGDRGAFPPKKSKNNGASGVYQIETKLKFIQNQKINHPGDPKREVAASPKSDERREWWGLVASEEKLESEMKELMKA